MDILSTNLPLDTRLFLIKKTRTIAFSGLKRLHLYLKYIRKIRSGNKLSRVFRHIFEHKHTKRLIGTNIAVFIAISSFLPQTSQFEAEARETGVIVANLENTMNTNISTRYPVEEVQVNQGYHFFHPGIDFEGVTGDSIYPVMEGVVENVQYSRFAYGNAILVDHENGYKSLYAHLSKVEVAQGTKVNLFSKIGEVGSTGRSSGDHLHLEIYENQRSVNPLTILSQR